MLQILWIFGIFSLIQGHVFDCLGKCQCYPEYKIIQCPVGMRNQLGLTSKADIEGFQVNDFEKKELKIVAEGTVKPWPTRAPRKKGKSRPRRDIQDKMHRFQMWLIDFRRKIQNMSRRH